jgi:hypothetical protein
MFKFTIKKAQRTGYPGEICPNPPILVETSGKISDDEAIYKIGKASVNGIELSPGERIRVTGTPHESLIRWTKSPNISIVFDWDGCDLTMFAEYLEADYSVSLD